MFLLFYNVSRVAVICEIIEGLNTWKTEMFEMIAGDTIWSGSCQVLEVTGDVVCLSVCKRFVGVVWWEVLLSFCDFSVF